MAVQRINADAPGRRIVDALERDGAVIVEGLLDDDLLTRFNAEIDPLIEHAPPGKDRSFVNDTIKWFFGAQTRDVGHARGTGARRDGGRLGDRVPRGRPSTAAVPTPLRTSRCKTPSSSWPSAGCKRRAGLAEPMRSAGRCSRSE